MRKIIFAGPVGAGKTTAIEAVSDTPIVKTDALATDEAAQYKRRTTVAMDYGTLQISPELNIQLVGTPGQERFSFMWEILTVGALGVVLLIRSDREAPLADLEVYLNAFGELITRKGTKGVVGITHTDLVRQPLLKDFRHAIAKRGLDWPVFEVDSRKKEDVKIALIAMLSVINPIPYRRTIAE